MTSPASSKSVEMSVLDHSLPSFLRDSDSVFVNGFAIPRDNSYVRWSEVEKSQAMIQSALRAKQRATEDLQEEVIRLQRDVKQAYRLISEMSRAELDSGTLLEEIQSLIKSKSQILEQKAQLQREKEYLLQERDLVCEQLNVSPDEACNLCDVLEERLQQARRVDELEAQTAELKAANQWLQQQLQQPASNWQRTNLPTPSLGSRPSPPGSHSHDGWSEDELHELTEGPRCTVPASELEELALLLHQLHQGPPTWDSLVPDSQTRCDGCVASNAAPSGIPATALGSGRTAEGAYVRDRLEPPTPCPRDSGMDGGSAASSPAARAGDVVWTHPDVDLGSGLPRSMQPAEHAGRGSDGSLLRSMISTPGPVATAVMS